MSKKWTDFLNQSGASYNDNQEVSFSENASTLTGEFYLTDLSWLGVIEVKGDDKQTFLQGQLTNDINAVSSSLSHISGLCTPKGRLRALFSIFSRNDNLYLQLPYPLVEANLKRLKMFVLMSKVELNDASDELIKIGLYGTKAERILKELGFNPPKEINMVSENNGVQLIRLAGKAPRFECISDVDSMIELWDKLKDNAQFLNTSQWRLLDIQAGVPNVFTETNETFVPQMLNLQLLNGINFKKGCYTGQEVVARMQYLGKLKRRMYRAHCDSQSIPLPGASLHSAASTSGQGAGNIVDAQPAINGGVDLLAVITNEAIDNKDIFLDEAKQIPLTIEELPYSFETE